MTLDKRELDKLLEQSFEAYKEELKRPWPAMAEDMATAYEIIEMHAAAKKLKKVKFVGQFIKHQNKTTVTFPEWQTELEIHFKNKYGESTGSVVFKKVIMKLFTNLRAKKPTLH